MAAFGLKRYQQQALLALEKYLRAARLTGAQGSGILTSMARANALLVVPEDRPRSEAGETLHAIPLGEPASLGETFAL